MTTIVYDHKNKQIACDSRITKGGSTIITDEGAKYVSNNIGLWFFSGDICDQKGFMNCYDKEQERQQVTFNASAFLVVGKVAYSVYMDDGYFCKIELNHTDCKGSGVLLALAALDHGKTAKEAVEYAMTRDMFTGGKVHVYDIEKGEFI
jgi:hypothetical protein